MILVDEATDYRPRSNHADRDRGAFDVSSCRRFESEPTMGPMGVVVELVLGESFTRYLRPVTSVRSNSSFRTVRTNRSAKALPLERGSG